MRIRAAVYVVKMGDETLYVGCSIKPEQRFKQHRQSGRFPDGATYKIVRWFAYLNGARNFEAAMIRDLSPSHNYSFNYSKIKKGTTALHKTHKKFGVYEHRNLAGAAK